MWFAWRNGQCANSNTLTKCIEPLNNNNNKNSNEISKREYKYPVNRSANTFISSHTNVNGIRQWRSRQYQHQSGMKKPTFLLFNQTWMCLCFDLEFFARLFSLSLSLVKRACIWLHVCCYIVLSAMCVCVRESTFDTHTQHLKWAHEWHQYFILVRRTVWSAYFSSKYVRLQRDPSILHIMYIERHERSIKKGSDTKNTKNKNNKKSQMKQTQRTRVKWYTLLG